ncbi:MAG: hypothetical protein RL685_6943, partial [Pseudomonadota bacterium]
MTPRRFVWALTALALASACKEPQPLPFLAHFSVVADEKAPVAGAQIAARGQVLGATDAAGALQTPLLGFE